MDVYYIENWNKIYENHKTRAMPRMDRVQIPINFRSEGYLDMLETGNGAALFGAWISIVQVAAKCKLRGFLVKSKGEPHDFKSLARLTGHETDLIRDIIEFSVDTTKWLGKTDLEGYRRFADDLGATDRKDRIGKEGRNRAETPPVLFESLPEILRNPQFFLTWKEWEEYRKEKKKPLIPMTIAKQLKYLESLGVQGAIDSINKSILNSWQGLFEPNKKETPPHVNATTQKKTWQPPDEGKLASPEDLQKLVKDIISPKKGN